MKTLDGKKLAMTTQDGKFIILVDPNQDGEALIKLEVDLAEVPDELIDIFKKKKD